MPARYKGNIDWTFGSSGYRHVWIHKNGGLFFGMARESDEGDAGVQGIGSAVVDVTPGDYFELIARQTSASTKNVAADELTCSWSEVPSFSAFSASWDDARRRPLERQSPRHVVAGGRPLARSGEEKRAQLDD